MTTPTKKGPPKKAPPKKAPAKKAAAPIESVAEAKAAVNKAPAAGVKPVAPPAKETAAIAAGKVKERVIKKPKTNGNYAWLLKRLQAQALNILSTSNNRATVRDGLAKCETFNATVEFLAKSNVADAARFNAFLNDDYFSATINR